ncbi:class I SAM-dependent rRNA methyltransferase [Paenibacillus lentus]|uniref:Class I SAM-dependent rRNA methyltransferase n=1 Tax=Paenibacillus lentus TaxID=1338368 RepID=A0A3Q8S506_9BACL|nr:class I SAM-dependent rRNA methyltransferase [Paenibacillus lentus]AZK46830.1 class I SAM-dependent rRNA methyltransferase [Paenibacillus lentus]
MPSVILQRSRKKRLEQGHPWIFNNEIERVEGDPEPGSLVAVRDWRGKFLATGYYNPASQITVRVVSYQPLEAMDVAFFTQRFEQCLAHRRRFVQEDAYRFVYGEADFLPGLIVDRFGDVLVVQLLTLGMDRCRDSIVQALVSVLRPAGIYERSDVAIRAMEGLEEIKGPLYGDPPQHVTVKENGLLIQVDIWQGQKTGYFFDQRENRASIEPLMTGWGEWSGVTMQQLPADGGGFRMAPVNRKGKEVTFPYWDGATVLECFSHTGSFTLHACKYGAKKVTCLDISEHAIQSARENVRLNGFEDRVEFVVADAFEYLRSQVKGLDERRERAADDGKVDTSLPMTAGGGRTWDVVILDPPAFAKTKGAVKGACRGYKDINLHGLKLVNEGGYLVTASCSYHMKPELFLQTIQDAAVDAGKLLRLIDWRAAGKDHPQILGVNEGHYLKFAIFEVQTKTF